jgi:hypothetical protein
MILKVMSIKKKDLKKTIHAIFQKSDEFLMRVIILIQIILLVYLKFQ